MKINYNYCCGVDWFQVYGLFKHPADIDARYQFTIQDKEFPTPQYARKIDVYYRADGKKLHVAEILYSPRLSYLPVSSCQLRLMNPVLYTSGWFSLFEELRALLSLEVKSISRIDLYYDCNRYKGGLYPRKLIQGFISGKYLKIGISRGYLSFTDWGYRVPVNTSAPTISLKRGQPNINAITFGQKGYIQTQIYNKTHELKKGKAKPYIYNMWERAGLDVENVWRTEIRIQGQGKSLQLLETGELFSLSTFEVANNDRIYELFLAYADRHVRFVKADYHVKRQQMKPLDLFCYSSEMQRTIKPKIAQLPGSTTQTGKVTYNCLHRLAKMMDDGYLVPTNSDVPSTIKQAAKVVSNIFGEFKLLEDKADYYDMVKKLRRQFDAERAGSRSPKLFDEINIGDCGLNKNDDR